ncbi:MAG: M1 family metallopeptidase [Gemmatimonadales bacterium]
MKDSPGQAADVEHVVITRDVGELVLERGKLYLLAPVGGCSVGAVFRGQGQFRFAPTLSSERDELERVEGSASLDVPITEAILFFMDSTAERFATLHFAPGPVPGEVGDHVNDFVNSLKGKETGAFSPQLLGPILDGERNGLFMARLTRVDGGALLFVIDPDQNEAVQLSRPVDRTHWGTNWAITSRFPAGAAPMGTVSGWDFRDRAAIPHYRLDVTLTPTGTADLDFVATASMTVVPVDSTGPWLHFGLESKLRVDSVRWSTGEAVEYFKAKDDDELWVRAPHRLALGDSAAFTIAYRGNLIDRYGNWFFIPPSADWWPGNREGQDFATFDLTFHSPNWYPIASVGERTDSTVNGKVLTTRWVTRRPSQFATFNLGLFDVFHMKQIGVPPIDVLISEDAHRLLRRELQAADLYMPEQKNMQANVAADVSNSLLFFTNQFGEPLYDHFWVTEIPYFVGVSFPGVIHLSWLTFQNTTLEGFDEYFRAHETAHQWWGNGVRPMSYRDAWLAEGLADFSGLWYLQSVRKGNKEYFKFLDQYADDIRRNHKDAGSISLGYRTASPTAPNAYHVMVYEKGAWVFHMLRTMMLDLQTRKEDRFTGMMRDFYATYQGMPASTSDFQQIVEKHAGVSMQWFFDQWVRASSIPTYRVAWTTEVVEPGRYRLRLRVKQDGVPPDFRAVVVVSVDLGQNRFVNFRLGVDGTREEYVGPVLPAEPKRVVFNELHSVLADVKMESWYLRRDPN